MTNNDYKFVQQETTIPIKKATRDRLRTFGKMDDTYDILLIRMMDVYEKMNTEYQRKYGEKK